MSQPSPDLFRAFARQRQTSHFDRPAWQIQAAIEYAVAFPEEVELALAARNAVSPAELRRLLPGLIGGDD